MTLLKRFNFIINYENFGCKMFFCRYIYEYFSKCKFRSNEIELKINIQCEIILKTIQINKNINF